MTRKYIAAFGLIYPFVALAVAIGPNPLCIIRSPNSILDRKEQYKPLFVCNRKRWATCTGAAWFHGNYLAVLNLYGEQLCTYRYDQKHNSFHLIQHIQNQPDALFKMPENLAVSPDGKLLALCNSVASTLNIYAIDQKTHLINPVPFYTMPTHSLIHNVRFSADDNYLAFVSFNNKQAIRIYKILRSSGQIALKLVYNEKNKHPLCKIKAINFTKDGRYVLLVYSLSVNTTRHHPLESVLICRVFNEDGSIGKEVGSIKQSTCIEDIAFIANDTKIVASDQNADHATMYSFNTATGSLDKNKIALQNPEAELSFPHGITISQDGKHLVVTNYGTDTFNLYQITD